MRRYINKSIERLSTDLRAGLVRLRKGYIDAAEELIRLIDINNEYPYAFVLYRLTGYRGPMSDFQGEPMSGKSLKSDLQTLMLDISDSFKLRTSDYDVPAYDTKSLSQRFKVSSKTIQRWRRRGLPARRLVFHDGRRRLGFLESSVQFFANDRKVQIARSMRFSQMTEQERESIISRAKRMARMTHCTLSDIAKRIGLKTARSPETIRYTIRRHDKDHPEDAIFPYLSTPLSEDEKTIIYRSFLRGVPAPELARQYNRTRGSIYRIINEMRAKQLIERPISYIYNSQFDLPNADEIILFDREETEEEKEARAKASTATRPAGDLPPYLRALYGVPLLTAKQERDIFRRYNYLKYKADKLRKKINVNRIRTSQLKEIESYLLQANGVKNKIVRANLRLVISIGKKHVSGPQTLFELISDGNVSLMRAVEKFDYSRGNKFSTYASWAIMRNYARTVPKERYQLDRFVTGHEEVLDIAAGLQAAESDELHLPELRESIDAVLAQLTPRERAILTDHFGLDSSGRTKTLDQLGHNLGISKERVRQIEIQALKKLRKILSPQKADLLT